MPLPTTVHVLQPHADSAATAVRSLQVQAWRGAAAQLQLRYFLEADLRTLRIPACAAASARRDGLWQHTCFEAFVRFPDDAPYVEFNFSPSGDWAAYRFSRYRERIEADAPSPIMALSTALTDSGLQLDATINLRGLLADCNSPWQLALTAVIEDAQGQCAYWSLLHAPGKPDFHHADGFVLTLPSPTL